MIVNYSINVIDLDKTLIPYDSFRLLIKKELFAFNLNVFWYTLLRVIRISSMKTYKVQVIKHLEKKYKDKYFKEFASKLVKDVDPKVISLIKQETKSNTINVIVSASPNIFVKYVINELNFEGTGSYFNEKGDFIHLYKDTKIAWLATNFKKENYQYHFAISDSATDDELLSIFNKSIKWIAKN